MCDSMYLDDGYYHELEDEEDWDEDDNVND